MILSLYRNYFLKQRFKLTVLMVKCGVLFEVRTEFFKLLLHASHVALPK
jgi:hypothetical protein